ncbi:hypothetical protein C7B67_01080 [filamentous cyanobacterium Phorm 6]|nr:hypothetical protein C7B67_01080 [filamentous cyanobacterium Phorm 6]
MHWGDLKDNGCVDLGNGRKARSYSAVLWDIPWGASWEQACSTMPADINGVHFDHPTVCVKANVVDTLSLVSLVAGLVATGAGSTPVGVVAGLGGAIIGATSLVFSQADVGALNMWGVFYVEDGSCG